MRTNTLFFLFCFWLLLRPVGAEELPYVVCFQDSCGALTASGQIIWQSNQTFGLNEILLQSQQDPSTTPLAARIFNLTSSWLIPIPLLPNQRKQSAQTIPKFVWQNLGQLTFHYQPNSECLLVEKYLNQFCNLK
ncbi:MAG: hypothetical protein IK079_02135 [Desulfovibrio sp.]|nr:hypothetical protein [Desulfovibrio sp.]